MTEFDRVTTESWTIAFPSDWIDCSEGEDTLYFEAATGEKGFYVSLWQMSEQELRGSLELVETFQATELSSFLPKHEAWELICRTAEGDEIFAVGFWEGMNAERKYWICGKQLAAGKYVLRATYHDYCSDGQEASAHFFSSIIGALQLHAT